MESIAHIREKDKQIQTVEEHLLEVKRLAEQFGEKIGVKHIAGLAGMLHDLGKYTEEFRNYILEAVNSPDSPPKRGSVDHSTAGGKLLYDLLHTPNDVYKTLLAEIVGNAIISHHSYLQDFLNVDLESNYLRRVRDKELDNFKETKYYFFKHVINEVDLNTYIEKAKQELIDFLDKEETKDFARRIMFLTKYVFSTLIDADRTNSREFEEDSYQDINDTQAELFKVYYERLMTKIDGFKLNENAHTPINQLRGDMSDQCDVFAKEPSGIYTLSIPTGGGKTLASLRYGLKHAKLYDKKRIIYIVPYTTIIEQNAAEVREILQDDDNILEHHSNVIHDEMKSGETNEGQISKSEKLKLARDNWDSPIVFTTMVQFLDTYYAYGSRNIRRLHNLSNAVIIFDEVQKVPTHCISLFNYAVNFLNTYGESSIILCTATQPALDFVKHKLDVEPNAEIINDIDHVVESFKRTNIIDRVSGEQFNQEKLVRFIDENMQNVNNLLVILNTKKVVKDLYETLKSEYSDCDIYHLSTSMCPQHRREILVKVRRQLENKERVICVSTQLIEAGVDVSFECVIRSLAGLDSIAQAAGRCNRHGEEVSRNVYIIDYLEENLKYLKEISIGKEITKLILKDLQIDHRSHGGSILSLSAMNYYFKEFYQKNDMDLDYPVKGMSQTMIELLIAEEADNSLLTAYKSKFRKSLPLVIKNSYQTAAKNFRVIDSPTTSVIVPYGEGKEVISDLNGDHTIDDLSQLFRKAQQYSVNLYSYQLDLLNKNGSLTTLFDEQVYALVDGAYDKEYGINIEGDSRQDIYAF